MAWSCFTSLPVEPRERLRKIVVLDVGKGGIKAVIVYLIFVLTQSIIYPFNGKSDDSKSAVPLVKDVGHGGVPFLGLPPQVPEVPVSMQILPAQPT